jgi:hypothetical protein
VIHHLAAYQLASIGSPLLAIVGTLGVAEVNGSLSGGTLIPLAAVVAAVTVAAAFTWRAAKLLFTVLHKLECMQERIDQLDRRKWPRDDDAHGGGA